MKLAIEMGTITPDTIKQTVEWVQFAENLGVEMAFAAEAWWSDAVTPLAYLADKTHSIKLATGIMQTTARTPAMTAMTALTLHDLSDGRFVLGLGASGPQVVEGLHTLCQAIDPTARDCGDLPHDLRRRKSAVSGQRLPNAFAG